MKRKTDDEKVTTLLDEAIDNNVAWCDAIARAHDRAPSLDAARWRCDAPMPPFHPNLITRDRHADVAEDLRDLVATLPSGWGVKDSHRALDLSASGFDAVVDADWYACTDLARLAAAAAGNADTDADAAIATVDDEEGLARWIAAWGNSSEEGARIFDAALLAREDVAFHALERGGRIVAGLVANRSGRVDGISNLFGAPSELGRCLAHVARGGRALVGYGDAAELSTLRVFGFHALGPLRIWIRRASVP